MPTWSFAATVGDVVSATVFTAELDLGMRLYHPIAVQVAAIRPRNKTRLHELLHTGDRVVVTTEHLGNREIVRAHIALADGRDLASALRGVDTPADHRADYGARLDKIWRYPAHILHVVDGDTIAAKFNVGVFTRPVNSIRVQHVNAPEKRTEAGDAATAFAVAAFPTDTPVTVVSHQLERYGRVLGTIELPSGADYGSQLLTAGHAVPYEC